MTCPLPSRSSQPPTRQHDKLQSPKGPPALEDEARRTETLVSWQGSYHQLGINSAEQVLQTRSRPAAPTAAPASPKLPHDAAVPSQ